MRLTQLPAGCCADGDADSCAGLQMANVKLQVLDLGSEICHSERSKD